MVNKTKSKKEMSKKQGVTNTKPQKGCSVWGCFCWLINKITKCLGLKCGEKKVSRSKKSTSK